MFFCTATMDQDERVDDGSAKVLLEEKKLDLAWLTKDHKAVLQHLHKEQREQVWQCQEQHETRLDHREKIFQNSFMDPWDDLNKIKVNKNHVNHEVASENREDMHLEASSPTDQDHLMEVYLVSAARSESLWLEENLEDCSLLEKTGNDRFELDSEVVFDAPVSLASEELDESSEDVDLRKTLLMQHCSDLTAQLEERDRQLEVLLVEVNTSKKDVQEALEKFSKATEALGSVQQELEAERARRLQAEEIISSKTHEEDNLKNKVSYLESQLENQEKSREGTDDLLAELREEKQQLLVQLREQEQLVRDVQEQKSAGDSVASEIQALFGRQLSALQAQRDRLQALLDSQQAKTLTASELLGQKTLELDSSLSKHKDLQAELMEREERLRRIGEEKNHLETRFTCLQQNLMNAEQALSQGTEEKVALEQSMAELEMRVKNTENVQETMRLDFQNKLQAKDLDLQELEAERKRTEAEHLEKESALQTELESIRKSLKVQEREHAEAVKALLQKEAEKLHKAVEDTATQRRTHQEDLCTLKEKHQKEVNYLNDETERKITELRAVLEEEQKKQIALIKQVHEREHQRELADLASSQKEALKKLSAELKESMEAAHQAELCEAQTQWSVEREALRLSLTNQHAAQLEMTQGNLQQEKEVALRELQAQHQAELDRIRELNQDQAQQVNQMHQQEIDDLKHAWETQMLKERTRMQEEQASQMEILRAEWQQESDLAQMALRGTQEALSAVRVQLEDLRASRDQEVFRLEEELSRACSDRDTAARAVEELMANHNRVLQEHQDNAQHQEELSAEREWQLQQQVERLQAEYMALKSSSEQEVSHVRSQLESMKANQKDLGELREQLLTRSSHAEDMERLKQEFSQQRRHIEERNEAELENLRSYFEQRLRIAEGTYREEITLLQLKLAERAVDEPTNKTGDFSLPLEGNVDEEKDDLLAEINSKLEDHKEELDALRLQLEERHKQELEHLRMTLTLTYREELLQVKTNLTDRYYTEIEDLKTKHSLELEQQRAKLSDNHVKEITKLRLQSAQKAARQVEMEVQERVRALAEEHQAQLAQLRSETEVQVAALVKEHAEKLKQVDEQKKKHLRQAKEKLKQGFEEQLRVKVREAQREERERAGLELSQQKEEMSRLREELERGAEAREALEQEVRGLQEQLQEDRRQLHTQQNSLETEQDPHILTVKQKIQAQFERELHVAKRTMAMEVKELNAVLQEQAETKLKEAQSRFREEKKELQERLGQQQEAALRELTKKHHEELESQKALVEEHMDRLKRLEVEYQHLEEGLQQKHREELDSLRADLQEKSLAQLEAREAELQARHRKECDELEARMLSNMDILESTYLAEIQTIRDERDRELQELRDLFDRGQQEVESCHAAELNRLRAEHQKLRRELAQVHMDKSFTVDSDLDETPKGCVGVSHLQGEPEGKHATMETLDSPGDRKNEEGGDLLIKLRADLRTAVKERKKLQQAHGRLLKVLMEVMRRTMATEEEISRRISVCAQSRTDRGGEAHTKTVPRESRDPQVKGGEEQEAVSDSGLWSALTDEGVELSQRLTESPFCRPELELEAVPEGEEMVRRAFGRLHSAVNRLLELTPGSSSPLEKDRSEEPCSQSRLDSDLLILQQHLRKAEGLLEGYDAEKAAMEEDLHQKETRAQQLVEELEGLQVQLQELREENSLLLHQREALAAGLGDTEKALLEEAQRLMEEKLDVQRQAEKDQSRLESRLRLLEMELDEQESCRQELEEQQRAQTEDLQQQIQALEKQLRHHRQFIDEQAMEREHERDEFQLEIQKLEARLSHPSKAQDGAGRGQKLENLQAVIKEKTEDYNTLLQTKEQYRSNLSEQNDQIEKMAGRIRELEQALTDRSEPGQTVEQLEQELQVARALAQDLLQDKERLHQQLYSTHLQISALQRDLGQSHQQSPDSAADQALGKQLESVLHFLPLRDRQLEQARQDLSMKGEELIPVKLTNQNSVSVCQLQNKMDSQKETVSTLHTHPQSDGEESYTSMLLVPLAKVEEKNREIARLNEEIARMNEEIARLQQEADVSRDKAVEEKQAEVEELCSQVERLCSDQDRLRRDREEEVEQLHEVIHKLQEELALMGPNRHEVSSSPEYSPGPHGLWPPHSQEGSLCFELTPHCPQPSRARLRDLQEQLDCAVSEKETTQQLLRSQEEAFHMQVEALRSTLQQEQQRVGRLEEECSVLRAQLSQHMQAGALLHCRGEDATPDQVLAQPETLRTTGEAQRAQGKESQSEIYNTETVKSELCREGQLQEEIQRLQQEVTLKNSHIQELNSQLEAHREVLTFSEETLAKAGGALRENEEHLAQLRAERDALRAELVAVKVGLNSSTERAKKLLEEGQTKDKALADLEIHNHHLKSELQGLQVGLAVQEEELAHQQRELEQLQYHCRMQHSDPEPGALRKAEGFLSGLSCEGSLRLPELLCTVDCSEGLAGEVLSSHWSELSPRHKHASQTPEIQPTRLGLLDTHSPDSASATETLHADQVNAMDNEDPTRPEEWARDGDGSNVSSEQDSSLQVELDAAECLNSSFVEYLRSRGMAVTDRDSATESMGQYDELLSPELQGLLKRVYQEGYRVLSLSQRPAPFFLTALGPDALPHPVQTEKQTLQDTALSLKELLCKMADREHKDAEWRRELLQELRGVFHSERLRLCSELQSVISAVGPPDPAPFMKQLERLLKQQEQQQQQSLEQLLSADHRSLMAEMRNVQALLHTSCLKNQEQLQQLQGSLSAAKEEGSLHPRCPQAELQQEQSLAQTAEQTELEDRQPLQRAQQEKELEQRDLPQELHNKMSKDRLGSEEAMGHEQTCIQLQEQLQEELRSQCRRAQEEQMHQMHELQLSLEERTAQLSQLGRVLEQERVESANLRNELQMVQSHSNALIAQERSRASDALRQLEAEQTRCAQLADALDREKQDYSRKLQEAIRQHDAATSQHSAFIQELQAQLQQERQQGEELAAMMERVQQQAIQTKRQLEQEVQRTCEAAQREQEAAAGLRAAMDTLRTVRQEAGRSLETERQRAARLQTELDALREELLAVKDKQRKKEEQEREQRHANATLRALRSQELGDVAVLSEKLSWQKECAALQVALQRTESELSQVTTEIENKPVAVGPNSKMQRMYKKYLRAESFRKALVYQKRYLLRLLEGFQDCEKAILTLTAHMGTYSSSGDLQTLTPRPHPVNRFRTAVHVVIAILRLAFLVRKWQRAFRIGPAVTTAVNESDRRLGPDIRVEVLRRQQLGVNTLSSSNTQPHPTGCGLNPSDTHPVPLLTTRRVVPPFCPDSYRTSPLTVPGPSSRGQPAASLTARTSEQKNWF